MSHILSRVHTGTSAHRFLQRAINHYDSNALKIEARLRKLFDRNAVPSPSIHDAIARHVENDDVMLAQMIGGELHPDIEKEIAATVAAQFKQYKGELDPPQREISRIVGSKLASAAYECLSLSDRISIVRVLSKQEAGALCEKRIASRKAALELSVATI